MKNIDEILQQDVDGMVPLIKTYYEHHLGIKIETHQIEDNVGYSYQICNPKKIPLNLNLAIKSDLDAGELTTVLSQHFNQILKTDTIDYLISVKAFITRLKLSSLNSDYVSDHPEGAIVLRYMDGLLFSTIETIKENLSDALLKCQFNRHNLLNKPMLLMTQLESIMPELNLEDLLNFRDIIQQLNTEDAETQEVIHNSLQSITTHIQKKIHQFTRYADRTTLHETLPNLKSQLQFKKLMTQIDLDAKHSLRPMIDESIVYLIQELVLHYKEEVQHSYTDPYKTKKLQLIDQLTQTTNLDDLLKTIQTNQNLLTKSPIGRYLYDCVCWFLNIKNNSSTYQMKMFDTAVSTAEPPIGIHQHKPKGA
ncbi:MAG: hypothetical protein CK424_02120 [Legionella sp.]|nr:MAG: hypothetical protein CK424_02120 [Legionella sp.]